MRTLTAWQIDGYEHALAQSPSGPGWRAKMATSYSAIAALPGTHRVIPWLLHLGGVGLIPLGLLDSSPFPVPGSMDVATILLAARDKPLWFYYALMATLGSVAGSLVTFRLARQGGKEAITKRLSEKNARRVVKRFERWGFAAIFVPALLPPPVPIVPFVIAAGGMQYSLTKFLLAMTTARAIRYTILAYLGVRYGHQILGAFAAHGLTVAIICAGVAAAGVAAFLITRRTKHRKKPA